LQTPDSKTPLGSSPSELEPFVPAPALPPDSKSLLGSSPSELEPFVPAPALPEDPAWNLIDVAAIAAFSFLALLIGIAVVMAVAVAIPRFHKLGTAALLENAFVLVPAETLAYLMVLAFMVQLVRLKKEGSFLVAISWGRPDRTNATRALIAGAVLAVFSNVYIFLLSRWIPKSLPIDRLFRDTASAYLLALFGIVVAPFVEEVFFRGFLYPALARRIGAASSIIVTSGLFALIHQGQLAHAWLPLVWLFIVGLVLTMVRARTKSVSLCVLIHMTYNTVVFAFVFLATHAFHQLDNL
jgi:uncharacterized protein